MAYKEKSGSGNKAKYDDQAQKWSNRIRFADTFYKQWENRFDCDRLEDYYEGYHWKDQDNKSYKPYTINLIYSTIEVKAPSLLFSRPIFNVTPKPWKADFDEATAYDKALLKQDTINSFVQDKRLKYADEAEAGILDAWFRFGMTEVGYSADWMDNPNAGKPILKSDNEPYVDEESGEVIKEPSKLPKDERIYVKNIPAATFRVGGINTHDLSQCNWFGYYEWVRVADLKANPNLENLDFIQNSGRTSDFQSPVQSTNPASAASNKEFDGLVAQGDVIKVWKLWETRWKQHYIYAESQNLILRKSTWDRIPLFPLIFHKRPRRRGFYPIPPVWPWVPPQNEINESREMNRVHRRRFVRKYIVKTGAFTEGEFDKLMSGGDGSMAETEMEPTTCITPLPLADLGASEQASFVISKDDFNIVSGTTSEERGQADRQTATQANITNSRASIRESKPRSIVAEWLCEIAKEILLQAKEKLTDSFWIKRFFDADTTIGMEMPKLMHTWQQITSEDLEDEEFEVDVQIDSLSPVTNDNEKKKFLEILAVLNQYPQLSMSPTILNELFDKYQYRNTKVRAELLKMATLHMIGQAMMAEKQNQMIAGAGGGGQPGGAPGQLGQNTVANATPPTLDTINNNMAVAGNQQ